SREGRQINEVQRGLLHTSRNHETEQKRADVAYANFQNDLAGQREVLDDLERKTRNAFRGYAAFRRLLDTPPGRRAPDVAADENRLQEELSVLLAETKQTLRRFRLSPLPFLFSLLPPWALVLLLVGGNAAAVPLLPRFGVQNFSWPQAAISLAGCLAGVCVLHFLGRLMVGRKARDVATAIGRAHSILGAAEH